MSLQQSSPSPALPSGIYLSLCLGPVRDWWEKKGKEKEEGKERYKLAINKCKLEIKQVLQPPEG